MGIGGVMISGVCGGGDGGATGAAGGGVTGSTGKFGGTESNIEWGDFCFGDV